MASYPLQVGDSVIVESRYLEDLFQALLNSGYEVIGPTVRDGAIVYDRLTSAVDLPVGWTDEQSAGKYRLKKRLDQALFGYVVGPHSWKQYLYPPVQRLWRSERKAKAFSIQPDGNRTARFAFIGVRACELEAIACQDDVFVHGKYPDPGYKARRESLFIVAVNCTQAGGNCFCTSMNTGPKVAAGYDLVLTEMPPNGKSILLVEIGTERGAEILSDIPHEAASPEIKQAADHLIADASRHMGRSVDTRSLKDLLYRSYENPQWENVAARCLSCGNCTMVCPTCFCTTTEDVTDLTGSSAERRRRWDSCFTVDFSYIHGGSVRTGGASRYRQWLIHKFATWIEQFGKPGCVGCGRCISWCPVGIDVTAEVRAIRESETNSKPKDSIREAP